LQIFIKRTLHKGAGLILSTHQIRKLIRNQIKVINEQSDSQQIPADVMEMISDGLDGISEKYSPGTDSARRIIDLLASDYPETERSVFETEYARSFPHFSSIANNIPINTITNSDQQPAYTEFNSRTEDWTANEGLYINLAWPWNSESNFRSVISDQTRNGVIDHEMLHIIKAAFRKRTGISLDESESQETGIHAIFNIPKISSSPSQQERWNYAEVLEERATEAIRLRDWVGSNFGSFTMDVREAICIIRSGRSYTGKNQKIHSIIDLWNQDRPMEDVALRDLKCPLTSDITSTIDGIAKNQPAGTSDSDAVALAESVSMSSSIDNIRDIIRRNIIFKVK